MKAFRSAWRTRQPAQYTRLNRANPLAAGVDVGFARLDQPALAKGTISRAGTPTLVAAKHGLGWQFNTTSDYFNAANWPVLPDGTEYTYLVVAQINATGNQGFLVNGDVTTRSFQFRIEASGQPQVIAFNTSATSFTATGRAMGVGTSQVLVMRVAGGVVSLFQNGIKVDTIAITGTIKGQVASEIQIGNRSGAYLRGSIGLVLRWPFGVSDAAIAAIGANAQQLSAPEPFVIPLPSGGATSYPLTASPGALIMTGNPATLIAARALSAAEGSLVLTGQAAQLKVSRVLSTTPGVITLTGQAAQLKVERKLSATPGSIALTGQAVQLKAERTLMGSPGALTLAGSAATLRVDRALAAAGAGALTLTGNAVQARAERTLSAASGALTLSGGTADLRAERTLTAEAGVLTLTGNSIVFDYTPPGERILFAEAGALAMSGNDAQMRVERALVAEAGALTMSGADVQIKAERVLRAAKGTLLMTGKPISMVAPLPPGRSLTQADIDAIADAVWAHPHFSKVLTTAKFLALK